MTAAKDSPNDSTSAKASEEAKELLGQRGGGVDWRETNRAFFEQRQRLTLQINELEVSGGAQPDATTLKELDRLNQRLKENTSEIIEANLGLVKDYVNRFTNVSTPEQSEDYLAAGVTGLLLATRRYIPEKGDFVTVASLNIKREVLKAVKKDEHNNMGSRDFEKRPTVFQAQRKLREVDGVASPSVEQVAAEAGVTVGRARRILEARRPESLDALDYAKYANRKNQERKEDYSDLKNEDQIWLDNLKEVTKELSPPELFVLLRREGLDGWPSETLAQIAAHMGYSRETVRKIEKRAHKSIADRGLKIPKNLE